MNSSATMVDGALPLLVECAPSLVPELKRYIVKHRDRLAEQIRRGGQEAGFASGLTCAKSYDGLLCSLFHAAVAMTQRVGISHPVAVAAVGSYGRGALSPYSDLDVRLICERSPELAKPLSEALLYPLWDAGLQIGHQVVTPDEVISLGRQDLPTATSLLDWRVIAGDPASSRRMLVRVHEGLFGEGDLTPFLEKLQARCAERYERYGDSVYLLEPDVKNGPGGLRDWDVAHWAARARWKVSHLSDLVKLGILVPREWQPMAAASEWLWRVRNYLHVESGRRSDRLSFERQEMLAEEFGYGPGGPGVERFMSDHYRHARVISRARAMILGRALPPPKKRRPGKPIGGGLKLTEGALGIVDPAELTREPALALRLFAEALSRDLPIVADARDSVARAASSPTFGASIRCNAEAARLFIRLLTTVQRSRLHGSVLKELHELGLLEALVPEFAPVIGRVHHDVYHVLTVDAHSVAAVDKLQGLCRGDWAEAHPLASRLAAEVARPEVLFFATLLHDVGKDVGGKDHSNRGAELAEPILARFAFEPSEIAAVQHLIRKHLRMYHVATRRDIDDPQTLENFCNEVLGPEGLRELYLLTLADVSTTSPTALSPWKARMLEDLYVAAEQWFSEGGAKRGREHTDALGERVRALCPALGEREFLDYFLGAMPERYLYANKPSDIVRHSRFARQAQTKLVNVVALATDGPYVEVGFVTDDRPGLLATITATLAAARLKVVAAQVYSFRDAYGRRRALDLFWVRSGSDPERVRAAIPRIERDFARLVSQELTPADLVRAGSAGRRRSSRAGPRLGTTVTIDNRAASAHTLIEVITEDRPNLLFGLASSLQQDGLSIGLAKINTEGNQVADVFYVSSADGAKVLDEARLEQIRTNILSTITAMEQEVTES